MGFWYYMFSVSLLIPISMILMGAWLYKHPPKKINGLYGYRTKRSMKNQDTWIYAQRFSGRLYFRLGLGLLPLSAAAMLFSKGQDVDTISRHATILSVVQLVLLLLPIFFTERSLRKTFDDDGRRL